MANKNGINPHYHDECDKALCNELIQIVEFENGAYYRTYDLRGKLHIHKKEKKGDVHTQLDNTHSINQDSAQANGSQQVKL
jgi:hypothetical protein